MKLILPLILLVFTSCKETTSGIKDLTPDEIAYLRERAAQQCATDNEKPYSAYKNAIDTIYASTAWDRAQGFLYEYKNGTAVVGRVDIKVWKRNNDLGLMHFYIVDTVNSVSTKYFLKTSISQNRAIIDNLKSDQCAQAPYKAISISESGPLSVTYAYNNKVNTTSNYEDFTDVYTFNFTELPFMAAYRLNRTVITMNSSDVEVSSPGRVTYTSTITDNDATFISDNYQDGSYTQKFCELALTGSSYRLVKEGKGFPLNCVDTKPANGDGWDLSI